MNPSTVPHPPLDHFLAGLGPERVWAEVLIRREGDGFELRHVRDREVEATRLRTVPVSGLRALADRTAEGEFRPLKAAPGLVAGWRCPLRRNADLAAALHHLYPGSLADAWAEATRAEAPVSFLDFTARLEGRARHVGELGGTALAAAVEAGCGPHACLKRRRWTVPDLAADDGTGKSAIPCLEPCPVFLAFARACMETEHAPTVPTAFAPDDLATLAAALRHALKHPPTGERGAGSGSPLDPRRIVHVLARHRCLDLPVDGAVSEPNESD